jgi:hypothetical protein
MAGGPAMQITPLNQSVHGPCSCCGDTTRTVWGEARADGALRAIYYVRWSPEHLDEHTVWLLYIGPWGSAPPEQRVAVALYCRSHGRWPAFMVVDAHYTPWGEGVTRLGRPLRRGDVVGQPIGVEAYAIAEQVLIQDSRVTELMRTMFTAEPPRWRRWLADRWGIGRRVHRCQQRLTAVEVEASA